MSRRIEILALFVALLFCTPLSSAQDWAKERLENSPRHLEWVEVAHGDRKLNCFVAYPEVSDDAQAVIVIHEIFGLTDWVRGVCDQLAEAGYIAIAPDLLSGMGPDGGGTESLGGGDGVRRVIRTLPPDQITADLNATAAYVTALPACDGTVSVAGFCWGGSQSFRYATNNKDLKLACVFYGSAPTDADQLAQIACPVHGFYGENDNRVNATIDGTTKLMGEAERKYDPKIYPGAGHGFMRAGEQPGASEANSTARDAAWQRWKKLLDE